MSKMPTAPRPKTITETREKSYTDQLLAFMPMWKLMGFEGLEGRRGDTAKKGSRTTVLFQTIFISENREME